MVSAAIDNNFEALLRHLKDTRGFDFTAYKRSTLMRRVQKRMATVGVDSYTDYLDHLEVDQDEFQQLFDTILINVTAFLRDAPAWDYLAREVVPRIIGNKKDDSSIRIWCAGCASGEEPYSMAMIFAEALGRDDFRRRVKIYATDVDEDALSTARQAVYSNRQVQDVPEQLRERYFEPVGESYTFRKEYRRDVIFGRHDLLKDAPISRIDLLASRNTLMYFNSDAQALILARFFYALREGGYLFLGKAETLLAHSVRLAPVELKYRIFVKPANGADTRQPANAGEGSSHTANDGRPAGAQISELAYQGDPAAQLAVDPAMTLLLANDKARHLFGLGQRDIGRPLQDLEISYRPVELRSLIAQTLNERHPTTVQQVSHPSGSGARWYDVMLMPLIAPNKELLGVNITFIDVTLARELSEELQQSRMELETAYEELQSSNEELETTNEELQSTVEELETTNEELQSSNEELETMNEELQSTNEELEAVNDQLRDRGIEVQGANLFLESILASVRIGVAVVDSEIAVKAWNYRAEDLWGLRADEVRNIHLLNLDIGLQVANLLQPIRDCLAGRVKSFEDVFELTNRRGQKISCRITLNPIIGSELRATGVVILMEELEPET